MPTMKLGEGEGESDGVEVEITKGRGTNKLVEMKQG